MGLQEAPEGDAKQDQRQPCDGLADDVSEGGRDLSEFDQSRRLEHVCGKCGESPHEAGQEKEADFGTGQDAVFKNAPDRAEKQTTEHVHSKGPSRE